MCDGRVDAVTDTDIYKCAQMVYINKRAVKDKTRMMIRIQILPRLRNDRVLRRLIDLQLKHVRSAVMTDDVKVELPAADLAQIKRSRQNGFALKVRPREDLAQRADDGAAAAHQHLIR